MMGMGRLYTVEFHAVTVSAQQDLFYIKPAADKVCFVEDIFIHNVGGAADAGDAQEEDLSLDVCYVPATVTASAGGNSFTPVPQLANDSAAGFAARINDTTKATSSGTIVNRWSGGWNVRMPFDGLKAPEHRFPVANAAALTFRLNTTPADALSLSGTMMVRELP